MNIIMGVDRSQECDKAVDLVLRLLFAAPRYTLVHVLERLATPGATEPAYLQADQIARLLRAQEVEGHSILVDRHRHLAEAGVDAKTLLAQGFVANELLSCAEAEQAALVAVGCSNRGAIDRLITGSVSRKIVINAPCSVLVAKEAALPDGPVAAVLATDHSPYANRCVDLLRDLAPAGLSRLTVMTAYPLELPAYARTLMPHFQGDFRAWVEERLLEENQAVIARLSPVLTCKFVSQVVDGSPEHGIEVAMRDSYASLLILGAQGHRFLQRATAGSVSYREAMQGAYNTLILRAPLPEEAS